MHLSAHPPGSASTNNGPVSRFFDFAAHGTTARREVIGGLTTFAAMAYILAVNPLILAKTGMDAGALVTATAFSAALMTCVLALLTNYPIALAPGMGLNAFFTFTICLQKQVPWQAALGLVFYSGVIFFLLSVTGARKKLVEAIPREFKLAITCGIGLFIAFIGMKNGGLVVANPATFVTAGNLGSPECLLVILGVITTAIGISRKIPGAVILNIIALTIIDIVMHRFFHVGDPIALPSRPVSLPNSLAPIFLQLDLGWFWQHIAEALPLVFAILFVDLFDNMGTLIGVCHRAGLLDEHGQLPKIGRAFTADACAAMIGSCLGTSTVTSYIESAAGVEAGGRTGLTSLTTAACFLLALFFTPLILLIPDVATAPALIVIGIFMLQTAAKMDLDDFTKAAPAFVAIITMPLTFSISEGVALGLLVYVGLQIGLGRARSLSPVLYILTVLFLLHYFVK
jgi:AGZA family xanthine/uracil permease-like MFS transporter